MRRHAFGITAILFFAVGCYFWWRPPNGAETWLHGAAVRIGMVLAALWLAYPELSNVPRWMCGVLVCAILIVMIRPKLIVVVAPALLVIWVLRPRSKKKQTTTQETAS